MALQNSSDFKLYIMDGSPTPLEKLISKQMSMTLDSSVATIDVTTKDSSGYEEFLAGLQSGEGTLEFLMDADATGTTSTITALELKAIKSSRAIKTFLAKVVSPQGKTLKFSFDALITKFTITADLESTIKVSMSLKQSGASTDTVTAP